MKAGVGPPTTEIAAKVGHLILVSAYSVIDLQFIGGHQVWSYGRIVRAIL